MQEFDNIQRKSCRGLNTAVSTQDLDTTSTLGVLPHTTSTLGVLPHTTSTLGVLPHTTSTLGVLPHPESDTEHMVSAS